MNAAENRDNYRSSYNDNNWLLLPTRKRRARAQRVFFIRIQPRPIDHNVFSNLIIIVIIGFFSISIIVIIIHHRRIYI